MPLLETQGTRFEYSAEAALTKRRLVKEGTADGEVDVCGSTEQSIGVCCETVAINKKAPIQLEGIALLEASAAIARGDWVGSAAAGKGVSLGVTVDNTEFACGVALSAAAADGDIISVLLQPVSGPST